MNLEELEGQMRKLKANEQLQEELRKLEANEPIVQHFRMAERYENMPREDALISMVLELAKQKKYYFDEVVKLKQNSVNPRFIP